MENELIKDLDEYFCRTYSDYTAISALSGYSMPERIASTQYNIEGERFKLCFQPEKESLLAALKERYVDRDFSFSFLPVKFKERLKDVRRKYTFKKILPVIFKKYSLDVNGFYERIDVSKKIWLDIVKGKFYPEKNTVLATAVSGGIAFNDARDLLAVCGYEFDYASVRDVVVSYMLNYKVYTPQLVELLLEEYKITCLPLKDREIEN